MQTARRRSASTPWTTEPTAAATSTSAQARRSTSTSPRSTTRQASRLLGPRSSPRMPGLSLNRLRDRLRRPVRRIRPDAHVSHRQRHQRGLFSVAPAISSAGDLYVHAGRQRKWDRDDHRPRQGRRRNGQRRGKRQPDADFRYRGRPGQRRAELHDPCVHHDARGLRARLGDRLRDRISRARPNESGQTLTYLIDGNDNPTLFTTGPAISPTGTLTFTPAPDANGMATITVHVQDSGATGGGNVNVSPTADFDIIVTPVNDAPSFTVGADPTAAEDAGPVTVPGFATPSAGPPDESSQTFTYSLVGDSLPTLFSVPPAISPIGRPHLHHRAANANGTAAITVHIHDDGGTVEWRRRHQRLTRRSTSTSPR